MSWTDRAFIATVTRRLPTRRRLGLLVTPTTILRWHQRLVARPRRPLGHRMSAGGSQTGHHPVACTAVAITTSRAWSRVSRDPLPAIGTSRFTRRAAVSCAAADRGEPASDPGRLADELGISRQASGGIGHRLHAAGLIDRAAPGPGLPVSYTITTSGLEQLTRAAPVIATEHRILERLPSTTAATLIYAVYELAEDMT